MNASLSAIGSKISRLIPLLGSDKDGEVVACVRAIRRTLASAGLDLHDLAKLLSRAEPREAIEPPLTWRDIPESERAGWLAEMRASPRLSEWEQDFCTSILAQVRFRPWSTLTAKQIVILDRCISKMIAEAR